MTVTLQDAINAIQSGQPAEGKRLLAQLLLHDPENDAAWVWMSATVDDAEQRRYCMEKALAINPENVTARAGLAYLGHEFPTAPPPPPALLREDHGLGQPAASQPEPELPPAWGTPAWGPPVQPFDETPIVEEREIGDVVAALNKEEPAPPPAPDADLNWLFPTQAEQAAEQDTDQELQDMLASLKRAAQEGQADEDFQTAPAAETPGFDDVPFADLLAEQAPEVIALPGSMSDAEAELLEEPAPLEIPELAPLPVFPAGQLWQNPASRSDSLVLVNDRCLILAKPDLRNVPVIQQLLSEGKTSHQVLGHGARTILLERISRLRAPGNSALLEVSFRRNRDTRTEIITLANPAQRDEMFESLKTRLGANFKQSIDQNGLWDLLIVPILNLLILVLITGLLFFGSIQLLSNPQLVAGWLPESVVAWLSSEMAFYLPVGVLVVGGVLLLIGLTWLVANLRKPRKTVILERILS